MLNKLAVLGCVVLVFGCDTQPEKGPENLILGPYKFIVPEYNIEPAYWSGYPYFPERETTKNPIEGSTVTLRWSTEDLASRVEGFVRPKAVGGNYIESIRVMFHFPSDENRRQYALNVRASETEIAAQLSGGGGNLNPILEAIPGTNWFRMKHSDHPNSGWLIVRDIPGTGDEQSLARQTRSIAACSPQDVNGSRCAINFQLCSLGLNLSTHLSEPNVLVYEDIADEILKDLDRWIIDNRNTANDLGT